MTIANVLRIPAQDAAKAFLDIGLLAGHATQGYARQVAEGGSSTNYVTRSAFWNMDEKIQRTIAGRLDFSASTNMVYATPVALEDAINDLSRIADDSASEVEMRTQEFRAAKGQDEEVRNAILRQIDVAEGRKCSANILSMLACGCKILAEGQSQARSERAQGKPSGERTRKVLMALGASPSDYVGVPFLDPSHASNQASQASAVSAEPPCAAPADTSQSCSPSSSTDM